LTIVFINAIPLFRTWSSISPATLHKGRDKTSLHWAASEPSTVEQKFGKRR
jgi:hypothetical protein